MIWKWELCFFWSTTKKAFKHSLRFGSKRMYMWVYTEILLELVILHSYLFSYILYVLYLDCAPKECTNSSHLHTRVHTNVHTHMHTHTHTHTHPYTHTHTHTHAHIHTHVYIHTQTQVGREYNQQIVQLRQYRVCAACACVHIQGFS